MSGGIRTTFSTSRLIEFASKKELIAQTGHGPEDWPLVIVKELVDNALDAAEESGIRPKIQIIVADGKIQVRDNGSGIPPETVASICDFTTRTSSREAYVAPDRGAQGNALKTVLAMPFALSGTEGLTEIRARGAHHQILFRIDQIQQIPVLDLSSEPDSVKTGTTITVHWPQQSRLELQEARPWFLQMVEGFALLNPHASFSLSWRADDPDDDIDRAWSATQPEWPKWTPAAPSSPHWYRRENAERLIAAYITHDRERGRVRTVSEFVAEFNGLTGTAKRKAVVDAVGLAREPLSCLVTGSSEFDHEMVDFLLEEMCDASKPIKPEKLGVIGKKHLVEHFEAMGADPETFQYRIRKGTDNDRPWIIEVAFAYAPEWENGWRIFTGVNWSPGIEVPFRYLGQLLGERHCSRADPIVLFIHLAMPRPSYTDRGKSTLALSPSLDATLAEAVRLVTERWRKQCEAEIRDHEREWRRRDALARMHRTMSIKEAAFLVIPEAYAKASSNGQFPALARQIYYPARPKILELTGKDTLDASYFSYTLLPLFQMNNPELTRGWRIHFKPRGTLTEPHTGRRIPLGTAEVENYRRGWTNGEYLGAFTENITGWKPNTCGPHNRFSAVVVIEKEGFADLLIDIGLGGKWDIAIVGNEGQSVEAELKLADALKLPVFVLHDFDRSGLTIGENLRTGTWRHWYRNRFPVIEIGLRLHQIAGLESEPISKKNLESVSDDRLRECGATEADLDFLRDRRVELNALTTEQLVELVERALTDHGVKKVIPSEEDLAKAWRAAKAHSEIAEAVKKAAEDARRWRKAETPGDLTRQIRAVLKRSPRISWDAALLQIIWRGER